MVGGQLHAPAALSSGKTRYQLYRRLGRSEGQSGRVRKNSPPPGFDPRIVQPVVSRYIDWAIPVHNAATCSKETGIPPQGVTWSLTTVWCEGPELLELYVWKSKWKVAVRAMKANRRSGGPIPLIHYLDNCMWLCMFHLKWLYVLNRATLPFNDTGKRWISSCYFFTFFVVSFPWDKAAESWIWYFISCSA